MEADAHTITFDMEREAEVTEPTTKPMTDFKDMDEFMAHVEKELRNGVMPVPVIMDPDDPEKVRMPAKLLMEGVAMIVAVAYQMGWKDRIEAGDQAKAAPIKEEDIPKGMYL
jgi:hypothetical protein